MEAIVITGMHRSGTSYTAHALHELGVSLGRADFLLRPGGDNPTGYWENRLIKELDDEVLAHLGGSWDQPPILTAGWARRPGLDGLRRRAHDILVESFGEGDQVIAFKDPRLSLLAEFWRSVVPISTLVVVVRDPLEVSASLAARNDMAPAEASLLWIRHLVAALAVAEHYVLRYTDLIDAPKETLTALAARLGLAPPTSAVEEAVQASFDPTLHHHRSATLAADLPSDPVSVLARRIWDDGQIDLELLPEPARTAIAEGWIRTPPGSQPLALARAKVNQLEATLRKRELSKRRLDARREELDRLSRTLGTAKRNTDS